MIKPVGEQTTMLVLQVGLLGAIGGVVAASPAFPVLTNGLLHMGGPALFKVVLAIALPTGASGSDSMPVCPQPYRTCLRHLQAWVSI